MGTSSILVSCKLLSLCTTCETIFSTAYLHYAYFHPVCIDLPSVFKFSYPFSGSSDPGNDMKAVTEVGGSEFILTHSQ